MVKTWTDEKAAQQMDANEEEKAEENDQSNLLTLQETQMEPSSPNSPEKSERPMSPEPKGIGKAIAPVKQASSMSPPRAAK